MACGFSFTNSIYSTGIFLSTFAPDICWGRNINPKGGYLEFLELFIDIQGADGKIKSYGNNRGVGGKRIVDLYARVKADIINLEPDYLSILICVNDVWHELEAHNGVDVDKYQKIYCILIEEL